MIEIIKTEFVVKNWINFTKRELIDITFRHIRTKLIRYQVKEIIVSLMVESLLFENVDFNIFGQGIRQIL